MAVRVALYGRYSSDLQSAASIEDQLRLCTARAEREGWIVIGTYTDAALSGTSLLRPGYQALLGAIRGGKVDIVLAESLDRFSRDLEHVAAFHKQATFHRVKVVTLAEGEISELHVGLKGTMGALYLKDLAQKTHRGQEGRIRKKRACGRTPYGYRPVRRLGPDGEPERGLREIEPAEAATVLRIFRNYAEGLSPRAIAAALNAEGVPGPAGTSWYDASIRGRPGRDDGILRNPAYVGVLRWNRHARLCDPLTGSKVIRARAPEDVIEVLIPELRIIDDALWQRAQARLIAEAAPVRDGDDAAFWDRRRPRHLLSGKVVCGVCGHRYGSVGKDYLACATSRNGRGCSNTRRVRRPRLEASVMEALSTRVMRPDHLAAFCGAFVEEWNKAQAESSAGAEAGKRELQAVERKLENLIEAIADGVRAPGVQRKLEELEARKEQLLTALQEEPVPAPALHPNLARVYAQRVALLRQALEGGEAPEVLEAARALIDKVVVRPGEEPDDPPEIELVGHLMAMLKTAGAFPGKENAAACRLVTDLASGSTKEGMGEVLLPQPFRHPRAVAASNPPPATSSAATATRASSVPSPATTSSSVDATGTA